MLKRLAVAGAGLAMGLAGTWKVAVAEYFGRVDLTSWAAEHPSPPAPRVELGPHRVSLVSTRRVVPSAGLDPRNGVQRANNNLDVVRHEGRVYLAWRSAQSHFASDQVVMNVASSEDEQTWRYETSFRLGRDLREPRLLSMKGRLFLYLARLGDKA